MNCLVTFLSRYLIRVGSNFNIIVVNMASRNPLSFLGLRKRDEPENDEESSNKNSDSPKMSKGGLELNRRGVPARKRKLNSLIYGMDEMVSIPVKSPKKRNANDRASPSNCNTS